MKADDIYNITDNLINGTGNKTNAVQDKTLNQIMGWLTIVILLGIVLFNSLVICLILSKKKKTRMSFFVGNLAIADLSLGILFVLPESLKFLGVPINIHYCYIFYVFFSMVPYYASTYAIVVLAVDRLYAITRPVSAASKGQMYKLGLCISTWVVGVVLAIQYGVVGVYDYKTNYCSHIFEGFHKSFILYFDLFVMVIIPLAIIIVCYSLIVITIYRREKRGFIQASAKEQADDVQSKSRNISNAKIKTIKLLFVVVSVYLICWLPFFIGALLLHHRMITSKAFIVLYTFAPTNSLANPLVFLLFNFQMFRRKGNGKRKIMYHSSASCATRSLYVSRTQDTDL